MRADDAIDHNPEISRAALAGLHSELFSWCLYLCRHNRADGEDLMQQVYVELLAGSARFDGRATLKTFVFGVASQLARNRYRRLARRLRLLAAASPADEIQEAAPEAGEFTERAWQAVNALPARQRDMAELVFRRDLTVEEAAQVLGVSTGTGRTHYARAKQALADVLSDFHPAGEQLE